MKIAFPSNSDAGLESPVFNHFGTARFFIVVDTGNDAVSSVDNQDLGHEHGNCQPLKALNGHPVDAVVVGGIGGGALRQLQDSGIRVLRAEKGTVADNLAKAKAGSLGEFAANQICGLHGLGGEGCSHH